LASGGGDPAALFDAQSVNGSFLRAVFAAQDGSPTTELSWPSPQEKSPPNHLAVMGGRPLALDLGWNSGRSADQSSQPIHMESFEKTVFFLLAAVRQS
jgi:hypothetical protein